MICPTEITEIDVSQLVIMIETHVIAYFNRINEYFRPPPIKNDYLITNRLKIPSKLNFLSKNEEILKKYSENRRRSKVLIYTINSCVHNWPERDTEGIN